MINGRGRKIKGQDDGVPIGKPGTCLVPSLFIDRKAARLWGYGENRPKRVKKYSKSMQYIKINKDVNVH